MKINEICKIEIAKCGDEYKKGKRLDYWQGRADGIGLIEKLIKSDYVKGESNIEKLFEEILNNAYTTNQDGDLVDEPYVYAYEVTDILKSIKSDYVKKPVFHKSVVEKANIDTAYNKGFRDGLKSPLANINKSDYVKKEDVNSKIEISKNAFGVWGFSIEEIKHETFKTKKAAQAWLNNL